MKTEQKEIESKEAVRPTKKAKRKQKEKAAKSLLRLSNTSNITTEKRRESCMQLVDSLHPDEKTGDADPTKCDFASHPELHLFSNSDNVSKLIDLEAKNQIANSCTENAKLLQLWKGDLGDVLQSVASDSNTHPNLLWLALAPSSILLLSILLI